MSIYQLEGTAARINSFDSLGGIPNAKLYHSPCNFKADTIGVAPPSWDVDAGCNGVVIGEFDGIGKSFEVKSTTATWNGAVYHFDSFTAGTIEFWLNVQNFTSDLQICARAYDGGGAYIGNGIIFWLNGGWRYIAHTSYHTVPAQTFGTWFHVRWYIDVVANRFSAWHNGVLVCDNLLMEGYTTTPHINALSVANGSIHANIGLKFAAIDTSTQAGWVVNRNRRGITLV